MTERTFTVLFTKHKTQKAKKWIDGTIKVRENGKVTVLDDSVCIFRLKERVQLLKFLLIFFIFLKQQQIDSCFLGKSVIDNFECGSTFETDLFCMGVDVIYLFIY
jgi:hypothetical protein